MAGRVEGKEWRIDMSRGLEKGRNENGPEDDRRGRRSGGRKMGLGTGCMQMTGRGVQTSTPCHRMPRAPRMKVLRRGESPFEVLWVSRDYTRLPFSPTLDL